MEGVLFPIILVAILVGKGFFEVCVSRLERVKSKNLASTLFVCAWLMAWVVGYGFFVIVLRLIDL